METPRVILVEPDESKRDVLAGRLEMQGYIVKATSDSVSAAQNALACPPDAVIADLWMPSVSGVQLCRLLRAEAVTMHVPVILRANGDIPRNRFWAERAGATAYVAKGRMGELVRILSRTIRASRDQDDFFIQIDPRSIDIHERVSELLDNALFESVLAAEVRSLASCESYLRLFDLFSQFLTQVTAYRWMAIYLFDGARFAIHTNPDDRSGDEDEAREALEVPEDATLILVEDEDAAGGDRGAPTIVQELLFAGRSIGRVAMSPVVHGERETTLMELVGRELAGPIRMCLLVEEAQRLASYDGVTGIMNRRALCAKLRATAEHPGEGLCVALLDVDHFKSVNDTRGHAVGDRVLGALGRLLHTCAGTRHHVGRWGGEEFVVVCPGLQLDAGLVYAEQLRESIEAMPVEDDAATRVPVTASIGVAQWDGSESLERLLERADQAMYAAKMGGRNRVTAAKLASTEASQSAVRAVNQRDSSAA